jgi:hypothetical protein
MTNEEESQAQALKGRFYRGRILRLRHGSQTGQILAEGSRRVIPFRFALVRLLGAERFDELKEGMEVGFDVGWTSSGLKVCTIKVFPPEETVENEPASGEAGPGSADREPRDSAEQTEPRR